MRLIMINNSIQPWGMFFFYIILRSVIQKVKQPLDYELTIDCKMNGNYITKTNNGYGYYMDNKLNIRALYSVQCTLYTNIKFMS